MLCYRRALAVAVCDESLLSRTHNLLLWASRWRALQRNGMGKDLSWDKSAREYEKIFQWAFSDPAVRPW